MKQFITFLIFITTGFTTFAQNSISNTYGRLTLTQAIAIALENNLDIKIARNNFESSIINNHLSIAGGLPEVTAGANNNRTLTNLTQELSNGTKIQRNNVANNSIAANITGTYLLYNGMRVQFTKARLDAAQKQNDVLINVQVQNVIADVMVKYYDIVRQQGYIKTIKEALAVTLQRKRIIEIKQSVGLANNADRYQVMLDSTANIQDLLSQQNILEQSKADLMNLLVKKPDSLYNIRDTIIVDTTINIDTIKHRLYLNPSILSAEQQIKINELIVKEISAQRYPSVILNGGYSFNRNKNGAGLTLLNQTSGPFVGVGINVPIFNGGIVKRQQQIANLNTTNTRNSTEQLLNTLQTGVVKTYQAYKNSLKQLKTERENNIIAAALLDLVYKRYELGVGTIIDLRTAQQSYVEAGFRLVNLSYAAKVAEVELKRLASLLP